LRQTTAIRPHILVPIPPTGLPLVSFGCGVPDVCLDLVFAAEHVRERIRVRDSGFIHTLPLEDEPPAKILEPVVRAPPIDQIRRPPQITPIGASAEYFPPVREVE